MSSSEYLLAAFLTVSLSGCRNIADVAPSGLAVVALDGDYEGVIVYGNSGDDAYASLSHTIEVEAIAPWRVRLSSDVIGTMNVTVVCEGAGRDVLGPEGALCPNLTGSYIDLVVDSIANGGPTSVELVSFFHTDQWVLNMEYFTGPAAAHFTSTTHHPTGLF